MAVAATFRLNSNMPISSPVTAYRLMHFGPHPKRFAFIPSPACGGGLRRGYGNTVKPCFSKAGLAAGDSRKPRNFLASASAVLVAAIG